jgi:hypothetical protein
MPSTHHRYANMYERNVTYEVVQLLRINGAEVTRTTNRSFLLRLGRGRGKWNARELSLKQLLKEYGPGTLAYTILRGHQRAHTVPLSDTSAPRKIDSLA